MARRSTSADPGTTKTVTKLSVVISTLGNYTVLGRVLDGYDHQTAPDSEFEVVVVVDQADPDIGAADRAIGARPYRTRRFIGDAPGLSANRNTGYRVASGGIVLFTDNDTIPTRSLVSEHLAWHRQYPDVATAVLGHVRWAPELKITPFMRWLEHGMQFDYPSIDGVEAGWGHFYGANCSIKREFIVAVGDWDNEHLPYGYEDIDWAYRASQHGLRVKYNRNAVVDHLRDDMTLEFWQAKMRRIASSERQFVQLHPELDPWYFERFSDVSKAPPAQGRGIKLARFVPPWVPWLGPKVWQSADVAWMQSLAPHFLSAWREAELSD